jgi:hypothetical protein
MVVHTCNPSTQEAEAGRSGVLGCPELHIKLQASLDYKVRPYLKKKRKEKNQLYQCNFHTP